MILDSLKRYRLFRTCEILVLAFESIKIGQSGGKVEKVEIPSRLQNRDYRILLFDLYFPTKLTNFDALKS